MDEKRCLDCKYFRLHYVRYPDGTFGALYYGHCTKPRLKKRFADDTCELWEEIKYN